jgi:O-Antigen ligase
MIQLLSILVAAAGLVGLFYALLRPHWVFVLVLMMFPLEQLLQVYLPILTQFHSVVNYGTGFMALFAVGTRMAKREQMLSGFYNRTTVFTLLLYLLWFIGIFYSPAQYWLVEQIGFDLAYQVLLLVLLPILVLDMYEFRRAMTGLMVLGSILAVLVMANPHSAYYSGRLVLDLGMVGGGVSNTGNPLALAELGGTIALIAALMRPARIGPFTTLIRVCAFIAGMGLAIGSGSRGQVLAAGCAGVAVYPLARKMANPKQFVLMACGFAVLVTGIMLAFRLFIGAQNAERWSVFGMMRDTTLRLDMVWQLLDAYIAAPGRWVFGLGTNAYAEMSFDLTTKYVHNIAAEMLCEHGIVGALLFVFITFFTIKAAWRLWMMHREDLSMRSVVAVLLAISLYSLLQALKQGSMSYPAPFFWWLILSKLSAHEEKVMAESQAHALHEVVAESGAVAAADDDGLVDREVALGY